MARADLLIKLVKAFKTGDLSLFNKVVESIIAEEKEKNHIVLAKQLERALYDSNRENRRYNGLPSDTLERFLFLKEPKRTLQDMILSDESRRIIDTFITEHHRSDLLRSYNLEPRNRLLLLGSPGNGKTSLAEAMAESLSIPFYTIRYDGVIGSYLGETALRLKRTFDFIKTQNCILFFDEFDAIGKERGDIHETGEIKRVVSSLLLQIDSLPSYVIVIAATNHPELLDRATWRRFQIRMELGKPNEQMIRDFLVLLSRKIKKQMIRYLDNYNIISTLNGLNFAEIEDFIIDIQRRYVLERPQSTFNKIIKDCVAELNLKYNSPNGS